MLYHKEWQLTRKMFKKWWNHEDSDYPLLAFTAPREKAVRQCELPARPEKVEDLYLDMDYVLGSQEYSFSNNRFFGAAFPNYNMNIGPGSLAIYLGCEPGFSESTVWFNHMPEMEDDPEVVPLPELEPYNHWFKKHLDMVSIAVERAKGKCVATIPDLVEGIDVLASFRGNENLLMDMYDRPDWIHMWLKHLNKQFFKAYDHMYDLVKMEDNSSSFTAFQIWGPGKTCKIQCDYSVMISADMFGEFVAPYLAEQCRKLDNCVYHLDGKEEFQHLDHLLAIKELKAIQWTPGAGEAGLDSEYWFDFYHRVLDAGKSLLLTGFCIPASRIDAMIKEFGTKGVYYGLQPCQSEAEGVAMCADYGIPVKDL